MLQQTQISEYARRALRHGYLTMPISIIDAEDKERRMQTLSRFLSASFIDRLVLRDIIDHITYVRDYMIKKSINFMLISKDSNGEMVGVAHFVYSKSTSMLYLKRYFVRDDINKAEIIAYLASGADNYLQSYGFECKALLSFPSIKKETSSASAMQDIGMKFVFMKPLSDKNIAGKIKENPVAYPVKKDDSVLDMRVVMIEGYKPDFEINKQVFTKFLMDLENEKELHNLLGIIGSTKTSLTLKHIDEMNKLAQLLDGI